jgi:phosphate transport system substrate-binding protein
VPQFFLVCLIWAGVTASLVGVASGEEILGSGSTFAYPIVSQWSDAWEKLSGVRFVYQPIGSSAGVAEIRSDVVDVGITDAPLDEAQLLRDGLAQFPVVIGAIVPVVNLPGIAPGQLRFTGELLADIYLGKVKNWSDPAIAAVNPDLKLPNRAILVVYRSDGSGTTYNWADYLSKVSEDWKVRVGVHTRLAWPVGVGGKGSGGVASNVAQVSGAIGYIEYSSAVRAKLAYGVVRNRAGEFVPPTAASFQAATLGVDWAKAHDFFALLSDSPAPGAYPIMAMSFALVHRYPKDPARAKHILAFFQWAIESGQDMASALRFLPLPEMLAREVKAYLEEQIGSGK